MGAQGKSFAHMRFGRDRQQLSPYLAQRHLQKALRASGNGAGGERFCLGLWLHAPFGIGFGRDTKHL